MIARETPSTMPSGSRSPSPTFHWPLCVGGYGHVFGKGRFKLGFWFAQQGSIYVFVVLIAVYVRIMNGLDKKYGAKKED